MLDAVERLFAKEIYSLKGPEKTRRLLDALNALSAHHRAGCPAYAALAQAHGAPAQAETLADLPFVPVGLFKSHLLASVPEAARFKTLTSSGTSGQAVSRIVLDTVTAELQKRAMIRIMQSYLGKARLPMIVLDHPAVVKDRRHFSARGAGILGMMNFGRAPVYALKDETMALDWDELAAFLDKHADGPVFLFGFTFMVWDFFIRALEEGGRSLSLPEGILVHSGGWKKLADRAVSNRVFKQRLAAATGIARVHNFYGMVEQVGSIYVECEEGRLHAPDFGDALIRRPQDWSEAAVGEEGIIQLMSALPYSYPGHVLLTEDRGRLTGIDDCPCGRGGRTLEVLGRLPKVEARGCSDTFEPAAAQP